MSFYLIIKIFAIGILLLYLSFMYCLFGEIYDNRYIYGGLLLTSAIILFTLQPTINSTVSDEEKI